MELRGTDSIYKVAQIYNKKEPALSLTLQTGSLFNQKCLKINNQGSEESDSGYFSFPGFLVGTEDVLLAKQHQNQRSG